MFSFLRRLFGLSYSPREKGIFRYFDGSKWRRSDPFELNRNLEKIGGKDWTGLMTGINIEKTPFEKLSHGMLASVATNWNYSVEKLAELARKVFGLKPVSDDPDAPGLPDSACLTVLMDFLDWAALCEEEFRPFLILSKPEPQASGDSSATDVTAASSSTVVESSANGQMSSKPESCGQSPASTSQG